MNRNICVGVCSVVQCQRVVVCMLETQRFAPAATFFSVHTADFGRIDRLWRKVRQGEGGRTGLNQMFLVLIQTNLPCRGRTVLRPRQRGDCAVTLGQAACQVAGTYHAGRSRRIDECNRLVYRISEDILEIISCKDHYGK